MAVVFEREEQAINGIRALKCTWGGNRPRRPFPASDDLFTFMRAAKPTSERRPLTVGNVDIAMASAAKLLKPTTTSHSRGHTCFAPAHALADPSNGQMTIYSNDMKSYGMRLGVAQFLGVPKEQVRVVWMEGPQGYGRTAADDAGFEAAYLAKELQRPVRVQWMRNEEQGVGYKRPCVYLQAERRSGRAGQRSSPTTTIRSAAITITSAITSPIRS